MSHDKKTDIPARVFYADARVESLEQKKTLPAKFRRMLRQAKLGGISDLINEDNVHEYAPVGCLENTMFGNDRSGTVDVNLNLLKAVELALTGGRDLLPYTNPMTGKS